MASFSFHLLLHFLIMLSPFQYSASRQLPKLERPVKASTTQFGAEDEAAALPFLPGFATPTPTPPTPVFGDSVVPKIDIPYFQDPMLPPPAPTDDDNSAPIFPFPGLPSLPQFPPFPFIPSTPSSSPFTPPSEQRMQEDHAP